MFWFVLFIYFVLWHTDDSHIVCVPISFGFLQRQVVAFSRYSHREWAYCYFSVVISSLVSFVDYAAHSRYSHREWAYCYFSVLI
jgi:hypothetical protein